MRAAMHDAEVGDDVYGEDPSVNALEARAAEMLGKPAALFVASGTQSNLVALLTHCERGDEYIAGQSAHTYRYEGGGAAALGGIQPQPLPFEADGTLDLEQVGRLVKPDDVHFARTRLLCLENTQDGRATEPAYFERAREVADRNGLAIHLDGARYFNAMIATESAPDEIARACDSVSLCLSKGLGAPVGSVLVGSEDFIARARRWRKKVGGGMRQAGILAAGGLHALEHHVTRLAEDHALAQAIADLVNARFPDAAEARTNMVFVDRPKAELDRWIDRLAEERVRVNGARWVTHLDVDADRLERIERALTRAR
ncbi:MAG: low-specificity L-threonine aldolase [Myxococcota bacterium]